MTPAERPRTARAVPSSAQARAGAILLLVLLAAARPAAGFDAITSPDGVYVLAVGDSGLVHRTWNGGDFWKSARVGTADLRDVAFQGFTVLALAANDSLWRSADYGGTWSALAPAGAGLHGLAVAGESLAFLAGANGTLLKSTDGGATWSAVPVPTSRDLYDVEFADSLNGVAVGESLTVIRSTDGGMTWAVLTTGGLDDLVSVSMAGAAWWAAGRRGVLLRSTDGAPVEQVPFPLPPASGLDAVWAFSADTAVVAGGGGFVRRTEDGGASWQFAVQPVLDPIGDMHFAADAMTGWACTQTSRTVVKTLDGGRTWQVAPSDQDFSRWRQVVPTNGVVRGSTIGVNGQNRPDGLFAALSNILYRSGDRGETWSVVRTLPGVTKISAFVVSPKDSNLMVAAVDGPDRIIRSVNGGATWADAIVRDFSEYGTPLQMNPDRPDTLLFAPEDSTLYISVDFGANWDTLAHVPFRSPCDVEIVAGNSDNIWVGDGVTGVGLGQVFQSLDGGRTFSLRFTSAEGSEFPALSAAPLQNSVGIATQWSKGGVAMTTDGGMTWSVVHPAQSAWGAICAPDDPNVLAFGIYGLGGTYVSVNQGASFTLYDTIESNYSIFAVDRATLLATMAEGIYKFDVRHEMSLIQGQVLTLSPNPGGSVLSAGSTYSVGWNAIGVFLAVVEYQLDPAGPWIHVATVPAYRRSATWTVPFESTNAGRLRVRDAWGLGPPATSGAFTIAAPGFAVQPAPAVLPAVTRGTASALTLTLQNTGNGTLDITSITTSRPEFWTGRSSLSIAPGGSDTLGLFHRSAVAGQDTALVLFDTNAAPTPVALQAYATSLPAAFIVQQNRPNPFQGRTEIHYALPVAAHVKLEVFNLLGQRVALLVDANQGPGEYMVPFGPAVGVVGALGTKALPAGVYFYRFQAGGLDARRKMVLLR